MSPSKEEQNMSMDEKKSSVKRTFKKAAPIVLVRQTANDKNDLAPKVKLLPFQVELPSRRWLEQACSGVDH